MELGKLLAIGASLCTVGLLACLIYDKARSITDERKDLDRPGRDSGD